MTPESSIPPEGPRPGDQPPSGPPPRPSSNRDDDLIEAARLQAKSPAGARVDGSGHASGVAAFDALPTHAFAGYEILREIHRGGQGVVYQAIQKSTKRKVAIKVMHSSGVAAPDSRELARFEREVQILGQLNHPNIVAIHESGVTETRAFFYVMDYISGQPLDAWIKSAQRPVDDTLRMFAKICDAVNAAHLKGVIHRDLKPGNIRVDQAGEPHVLDFGLAKIAAGEIDEASHMRMMTMTGQFIGSLPWASPEQAEGAPGKIDLRTDVYSLGVILYQMLTGGQFPYRVIGNMRDVLDNILRAEPARPSTVRRQINNEVETIVLKCLAKERDRRYQSGGELARDIRHYLGGEPIEAKRDSGWYVITKTLNRHRVPVAVAVSFLVLLVAFAITMTALYRRAAVAERAARESLAAETAARSAEAEQRRAAETNFAAVRSLARTFIVDFEADIRPLRGATRARERILKEAREYLVRLAPASADPATADPDLLREIADAHDKVGDLQGGLFMARLGETSKAAESFAEARRIREALLARLPADPRSHADMARSLARSAVALQNQRKYAESLAEREAALAAAERAVALSPADAPERRDRERSRAQALTAIGDVWLTRAQSPASGETAEDNAAHALGAYARAADAWKSLLDADASDARAARMLAVIGHDRAMLALVSAQADRASPRCAELLSETAALAGAALADFDRLAASRPQDAELSRDRWLAHHTIGQVSAERAGLFPDRAADEQRLALEAYQRALAIAQALRAADEGNLEAQRDEAICLNKVGNAQRELGLLAEARDTFDRSLALRRDTFQTDPIQRHRRDLANGLFKSGEVEALLAGATDAPAPDPARLRSAEALLAEALEQFTTLRDEGVLSEKDPALKETERALAACRERLAAG